MLIRIGSAGIGLPILAVMIFAGAPLFSIFVAILAGMIIFPMVVTFNLDPSTAGPGLIFQTLPIAFGAMPFGNIIATFFF